MSLLMIETDDKLMDLARRVFYKQFELDPRLYDEYDEHRRNMMFDDIKYNLSYLDAAVRFDDPRIFTEYAVWLFNLLCNLIKDLDRVRVKDQLVMHYLILKKCLEDEKTSAIIDKAIAATEAEVVKITLSDRFTSGKYADIKKEYLEHMIKNDTMGALGVIERAEASGIPLADIYQDIIREVMYEVGNLWHQNVITVDKEHYCSSTTQVALSHFYPLIFSKPRIGYKIISCCVGSELHEMGIRMVSDLFEYNGWDSIYLGAAVPKDALMSAIAENSPHLVALSVTMPQHLRICYEMVNAIRSSFIGVKIAIGGRAFLTTDRLWEKWGVDFYAEDADAFVKWANKTIARAEGTSDV